MTTLEKITVILSNLSGTCQEEIHPETFLENLGFDSIDTMEAIMLIEDEFEISIDESEISIDESEMGASVTVQKLIDIVENNS